MSADADTRPRHADGRLVSYADRAADRRRSDRILRDAAPDLLAALKALAEDHRQLNGPCGCYGQRDRCINCDAEAAIAKAEGKEVVR
jgi:hypothetical protein